MSVGLPFANTFSFARPIAAPYRNAAGAIVNAAEGEPRFDHDADGNRLGMLVTAGPDYGQHDAVAALPGDWDSARRATVLWAWAENGELKRRGLYTTNVRATINACLNVQAHHVFIGAVAAFLPNLGNATRRGYVRYRNAEYLLGNALGPSEGVALGNEDGDILIESH
jgi:hypothetical protein